MTTSLVLIIMLACGFIPDERDPYLEYTYAAGYLVDVVSLRQFAIIISHNSDNIPWIECVRDLKADILLSSRPRP